MHGGYNYAYDKVAMPKTVMRKGNLEFYSTKNRGCASCSMHQMLGRHDEHPNDTYTSSNCGGCSSCTIHQMIGR